jgi:hypothetical protein
MKPALALALVLICTSVVSAETARQANIERKSAGVMPFSMDETHHVFTPTANGGTQIVMVMDGSSKQLDLVRGHLRKEAAAFARGDFDDPATLHGPSMPGLATLRQRRGRLIVRYSDIVAGGEIVYTSRDPRTIVALHQWFAAQVSDHGSHATMKM